MPEQGHDFRARVQREIPVGEAAATLSEVLMFSRLSSRRMDCSGWQ